MFIHKEAMMNTILQELTYPLDIPRTYLAMIWGSIDSREYQKVFIRTPTGSIDATDGGNFSCAIYVSSVLSRCGLTTGGMHATVAETIRDMCESGWYEVHYSPETAHLLPTGCVILWGQAGVCSDGRLHRHIGFFIGNGEAVSNHPVDRVPKRHHITFGEDENGAPVRPVLRVYHNTLLWRDTPVPGV